MDDRKSPAWQRWLMALAALAIAGVMVWNLIGTAHGYSMQHHGMVDRCTCCGTVTAPSNVNRCLGRELNGMHPTCVIEDPAVQSDYDRCIEDLPFFYQGNHGLDHKSCESGCNDMACNVTPADVARCVAHCIFGDHHPQCENGESD